MKTELRIKTLVGPCSGDVVGGSYGLGMPLSVFHFIRIWARKEVIVLQLITRSFDEFTNTDYRKMRITDMKEQSPKQRMISAIQKSDNELGKAYVKVLLNLPLPKENPPKKA